MTVSISKMSIEYYLQSAMTADAGVENKPSDMTAYYTESATPPGRWFGSGLSSLGMSEGTEVTRKAAIRLYEGLSHPETGEQLGRKMRQSNQLIVGQTPARRTSVSTRDSVAGFDLTFSAPKSVSALWALGDYGIQSRIEAAHRQAMNETMQWVEANVAQTRAGHGGVAHVPVTGLIGSVFDHWESRAGDPQLHSHAVVSNRVQRESDGQWVTLDSYTMHRHVVAISETYNSLLFDRLHADLGVTPESRGTADSDLEAALRAVVNDADVEQPNSRHRTELSGVPDGLVEEFSSRSVAIEQRKEQLIDQYREQTGREPAQATVLQLRQRATLETRAAKPSADDQALPLSEKKELWRERAMAAGHDPARIVQQSIGHADQSIRPEMLDEATRQQVAAWALADCSQRHPTFTRANVVASSERVLRLVRCESYEQRRELVDAVTDSALDSSVALTPRRSTAPNVDDASVSHRGVSVFDHQRHAGVWTTRAMLESEQYLMDRYEANDVAGLDTPGLHERLTEMRTGSGHQLSSDQIAASETVLTSRRGIDAVIGPAGTGKTTTMRAVADAWQQDHGAGSVVGLAPSAVSARVLGNDLGISTDNTSKWLYETTEGAAKRAKFADSTAGKLAAVESRAGGSASEAQQAQMERLRAQLAQTYAEQAKYSFRPGQLVIVDEASMVSTAQMTQLAHQAEQSDAKVVLVGDPAQLGSVDAGGFLGYLDRHHDPAQLDQAHRFANDWEQVASLQLRAGQSEVLKEYEANGRLHGGPDTDAADEAYNAWRADTDAGKDSILIAPDNETVATLNARAQTQRAETGDVDLEQTVTLKNDSEAGVGDVLLARRNDRTMTDSNGAFIANGTRLTLTEVRSDGSAVGHSHSSGGDITLDADYLANSTELGYATTAHRSQGVTTDTAHAVSNTTLSRELFYVSMTRGSEANHAYAYHEPVEEGSRDKWDLLHETKPPETPREMLNGVVERSQTERTATETRADELAWSNDLGRLMHEREYLGWAARSDRTQAWLDENYSPETAQRLSTAAEWNTLTQADPKLTHVGPVNDQDSPEAIIQRCQRLAPGDAGPSGIENPIQPATTGQDDLMVDVQDRTRQELAARRAALAQSEAPPQWYSTVTENVSDPQQRREAVDAVIAWRAVSHRDELAHPLGPAPEQKDHLRPYYDRAAATLERRYSFQATSEDTATETQNDQRLEQRRSDQLHIAQPPHKDPEREPVTVPQARPQPRGPSVDL